MADRARGPDPMAQRAVDVSDQRWGSDLVADLLRAYGFEFVSFNPGASFRGLEESFVNYNDNEAPEVVQVQHEGLSVSIAHGYAKATGRPALSVLHNAVGTLNGSMSLFNAYVDRVPVLVLGGNGPVRKSQRRAWIDWIHSSLDQGALVRSFTKWDDTPAHTDGVVGSIVRAFNVADTRPKGPTYVTLDHAVQENELDAPIELPDLSRLGPPAPMAPDPDAIDDAADRLVDAERPVILTGLLGDDEGAVDATVELAEALGAAVVDNRLRRRYNVPNTHPLDLTGSDVHHEADVVLALDVESLGWFFVDVDAEDRTRVDHTPDDAVVVDVGTHDLEATSLFGDYYERRPVDLPVLADTAVAVPALLEAVEERLDDAARERAEARAADHAARHDELRADWQARAEAAWDETPIAVPRLAAEVWDVIQDDPWVLVNGTLRGWSHRLWEVDEFDAFIGGNSGGAGVGYGVGAAIGGALAYAGSDRTPVNLQADGDLMQYHSGLWTMAHYDLSLFTVVHNNRTLYNSTAHRMRLADQRGRDASFERALIGTGIHDPTPDYATAAESMGVSGYGPVEDPDDLPAVLEAAWAEAKAGHPVLVDVVAQPR